MSRIVLALAVPLLVWLACGWPTLAAGGNLALFAALLLHTCLVVWQQPLFSALRADRFTYGRVSLGLGILSLAVSVAIVVAMLAWLGGPGRASGDIPTPAWAVLVLSMLCAVLLALLAGRDVSPLPKAEDRRSYENPTQGR